MSDEIETIDRNPKSWAAWKREAERLQKIIDGMALAAMEGESHTDDELSNLLWYSQEATCHSDPNYYCEFQRLATPGLIAGIIRELQERRKAAMDSEPEELPLDYLQGHKDGLDWAAQLAESNHPQTGDWLYDDPIELAKAIRKGPDMPPAQLAPVVPDEYVAPAMTPTNLAYEAGWNACRAAMLAAAPQSPGSEPATVPGKWIPISERMPEDEQEVLTINKMGHRFVSFFDKHSGLFFDRRDAPAACCIERVLVTHWMPLPAAPQEVKP